MGGVLDDGDAPACQLRRDAGQVDGPPAVQDGHDGAGGGGNRVQQAGGGDAQGGRVDVGEPGRRTAGKDRLDAGAEGEGGDDDLIAGADPYGEQGDVQGGGPGGHRDDIGDAEELGELALEQLGLGAVGVVAAGQHPGHGGGLVAVQVGQGVAADAVLPVGQPYGQPAHARAPSPAACRFPAGGPGRGPAASVSVYLVR
jgi:hypothetical protein